MNFWFECKVKFEKTSDEGKVVKVNDAYLIDALSFTEAEARIIEEMKPYISGEFEVANIKKVKIGELFENEQGGFWYRAKVEFVSIDEKGVEKRSAVAMYVQAETIADALEKITAGMKGSMADYEIVMLTKTAVMDVFKYKPKEQ